MELLQNASAKGLLFLDITAYPFMTEAPQVFKNHPPATFGRYSKHLKLGGIKITTDGSPQLWVRGCVLGPKLSHRFSKVDRLAYIDFGGRRF
jgi:hypothetical protein